MELPVAKLLKYTLLEVDLFTLGTGPTVLVRAAKKKRVRFVMIDSEGFSEVDETTYLNLASERPVESKVVKGLEGSGIKAIKSMGKKGVLLELQTFRGTIFIHITREMEIKELTREQYDNKLMAWRLRDL